MGPPPKGATKRDREEEDDTDSEERMMRRRNKRKARSSWDSQEKTTEAAYLEQLSSGAFQSGKSSTRLYVGNLCYEADAEQLTAMFGMCGKVRSIQMSHDPATNRHKGYCFIEYEESEPADKAYKELNGYLFGGRSLKVCRPNNPGALVTGVVPHGVSYTGSGTNNNTGSIAAEDEITVGALGRVQLMQKLMRKDKNGKDTIQVPKAAQNMLPFGSDGPIVPRAPPASACAPLPSKCIVLKNMVGGPEDLDDLIGKELKDECSKYGPVDQICIYDITNPTTSKVDVLFYVLFKSIESGIKAQSALNNRKFAHRRVEVAFATEKEFHQVVTQGEK